ncbi:TraR/DksA family transcriptional regulator [Pseudonocardia broussonetiae]|nr:TraR/DksA C4-type zinc finger protein [Pseudonocardia broussonetiae]
MDLDRARTLLTDELSELDDRARFARESREDATADTLGQEGALGQHPGDYGTEVATTMDAEHLVAAVSDQRRAVQDALGRIEDGTYGRCAVCDRQIDDERLEARPEVPTCREHADTPVLS